MAYAPLVSKRARTLGFMRWVDELQEPQTFVTASVEAPGRLSTMLAGAAVSLLPPDGNRPTSREFRILLLDEEFATIDALALSTIYVARTSTLSHSDAGTQEITGTETKLVDDSGVLSLVMWNITNKSALESSSTRTLLLISHFKKYCPPWSF